MCNTFLCNSKMVCGNCHAMTMAADSEKSENYFTGKTTFSFILSTGYFLVTLSAHPVL